MASTYTGCRDGPGGQAGEVEQVADQIGQLAGGLGDQQFRGVLGGRRGSAPTEHTGLPRCSRPGQHHQDRTGLVGGSRTRRGQGRNDHRHRHPRRRPDHGVDLAASEENGRAPTAGASELTRHPFHNSECRIRKCLPCSSWSALNDFRCSEVRAPVPVESRVPLCAKERVEPLPSRGRGVDCALNKCGDLGGFIELG